MQVQLGLEFCHLKDSQVNMPLSSIAFDRSPVLKDKVGTVQLPDYSVLFYYGKSIDWVNTPSGTLNKD